MQSYCALCVWAAGWAMGAVLFESEFACVFVI